MAEPEVAKSKASVEETDALERARDESEKKTIAAMGAEIEEAAKGAEIEEENEGVETKVEENENGESSRRTETREERSKQFEEAAKECEAWKSEIENPSSVLITGMEEIPAEIPNWLFEEELDPGVIKPRSETGIEAVRGESQKSETGIAGVQAECQWSETPSMRSMGFEFVAKSEVEDDGEFGEEEEAGLPDWEPGGEGSENGGKMEGANIDGGLVTECSHGVVGEFWDLVGVMKRKGYVVSKDVRESMLEWFQKGGVDGDAMKLKVLFDNNEKKIILISVEGNKSSDGGIVIETCRRQDDKPGLCVLPISIRDSLENAENKIKIKDKLEDADERLGADIVQRILVPPASLIAQNVEEEDRKKTWVADAEEEKRREKQWRSKKKKKKKEQLEIEAISFEKKPPDKINYGGVRF